MDLQTFKRALLAFADDRGDLDLDRGELVVQIRDEMIEARIHEKEGDLFVTEDSTTTRAFSWLVNRVARVPLLADRILSHVPDEPHFVTPSGQLLDHLDLRPDEAEEQVADVPERILELVSQGLAGVSTVLYVTSDAGEGKTTLISHVARQQAQLYKEKKADWLLVPISLGNRSFMTFDDVVVAELVNRLRFQLFYYEAFLELVRLRVLVPAFDGFEEMFVEGSSGEALSALGNLMSDLKSSGSVVLAARKAYFEYQSFRTQARLFDAMQGTSVAFARIGLDRWDRAQFLEYSQKRGLSSGAKVYDQVCNRLGKKHPLLTRAVLVERLVDVAEEGGVEGLLEHLGTDPEDYFFQFVNTIVEREASEKWIDRSAQPHRPLLTTEEHHGLLAAVAREMWLSSTDLLRGDYLDLVAELFTGDLEKPPRVTQQVIRRLRQHSLIVSQGSGGSSYSFDHEDFRQFYLGEALAKDLLTGDPTKVVSFLQKGSIPGVTADAALNAVARASGDLQGTLGMVQEMVAAASTASYVTESGGALAVRLAEMIGDDSELSLSGFVFPADSLRGTRFGKVQFADCEFQATSLDGAILDATHFVDCRLHRIEFGEDFDAGGAILERCEVTSVVCAGEPNAVFDPTEIRRSLADAGFKFDDDASQAELEFPEVAPHPDTIMAEHALRIFMRATHINEDVFLQKFGARASQFMEEVLPRMLDAGVLEEVEYRGAGRQRRFKLCVPMRNIDKAIPVSVESLEEFLRSVK